jgi:hypothetical protein
MRKDVTFEIFGISLGNEINRLLRTDTVSKNLTKVIKHIKSGQVLSEEDNKATALLHYELTQLIERIAVIRKRINEKVK